MSVFISFGNKNGDCCWAAAADNRWAWADLLRFGSIKAVNAANADGDGDGPPMRPGGRMFPSGFGVEWETGGVGPPRPGIDVGDGEGELDVAAAAAAANGEKYESSDGGTPFNAAAAAIWSKLPPL